jgi:hypothetical protein
MVAKVNISNETSSADFDFHVLMTCGKKVIAEIHPAVIPKMSSAVINLIICLSLIFFDYHTTHRSQKTINATQYGLGCKCLILLLLNRIARRIADIHRDAANLLLKILVQHKSAPNQVRDKLCNKS